MNYIANMTTEQVKQCGNPHLALGSLRKALDNKIINDNQNPLHYITQTINEGDGLKMTATFSEERKKHFEDNPL